MAMDREYLEEQRHKDYELLKNLEDEHRLASDPKQRAKFEREIQVLKEQIDRREAELKSLVINELFQVDTAALKKYTDKYQSRYGLLKLLGMPQAVQLEKVYTNVRFLDDLSIRRFKSIEAMEKVYREGDQRQFQSGRQRSTQDGITVANEYQYLMVLGGPGAGKSTFLRRLGLEALKGNKSRFKHQCIPVMLELKQFAGKVNLIQAIAREFEDFGFPPSEKFVTQALKKGKLLLLLDGLDEVPKDRFNAVIDAIQKFAVRYEQNRFVASCRAAAYRSGFQRFRDIELADFNDDQIQQFIGNWFSSELDKQSGTAEKCWEVLDQPANKAAKELAQTPLLLTFICLVYNRTQRLPTNRSKLYDKALDILLEEWAAEKRVQQDEIYQGLNIDLEKVLLSEIAYQGFVEDQLFFQQRQLIDSIKWFLADTVDNPKYLDGTAVLDAIAVQQGILVERAEDVFSFSHLTLQEYLTALYASQDSEQIEVLVTDHLADQRWREVFLLVAGIVRSADRLLLQIEKTAQQFITTPKLQTFLNWAEQITAGSAGGYNPVNKRAVAIFFALARTHNRALDRARTSTIALTRSRPLARTSALASDLTRTQSLARNLDHNSDLTHTLDIARALTSSLKRASDLRELKIFKNSILPTLIDKLKMLRSDIPYNNQSQKVWHSFADRIEQTYLDAFQLDREWLELSKEEANALSNYLYACELMVRCKESAVRVSRETWEEIEGRMLLPIPQPSAAIESSDESQR